MEALLNCLHLASYLAVALALAIPRLRRPTGWLLAAAAVAGLAFGLADGDRSLTTVHTYAGFDGNSQEVSMVRFPTGTVQAPGWQWPLAFGGFALLWGGLLRWLGDRPLRSPFWLPVAFAWSATASWLGMQWLAAPELLVQPVGLDRFLWPAGLAAALVAARTQSRFLPLFVAVGGGILVMRLPAALYSKYASDLHLGGCLDISTVRDIVNPMTQMQFEPRLVAGSSEQQFWLIWLEHVIFFPAVYLMSLFGIALGAFLFHRHGPSPK
jgi:hypothetical protein